MNILFADNMVPEQSRMNRFLNTVQRPMVNKESNTETFVAGKIMIDNFRWAGVPFYIRTGKRMATKSTKIVVQFKDIPMNLYYQTREIIKSKPAGHPYSARGRNYTSS